MEVVNSQDFNDNYIVDSLLTENKGVDIEISEEGKYIFVPQKRTDKIAVFNTQTDSPESPIETGYPYVGDGIVKGNYYYSSFYKYANTDTDGGILKIDIATQSVENVFTFGEEIDKLGITNSGELLYAVTPGDSSLHIIDTKTMREITKTKIKGSLKYVAVSKNNYSK